MLNQLLETIIQILTSWVSKFDSHAQHVEDKLDSLDQTASDIKTNTDPISDIKDNTGAVITPIQNIKTNTDSIATSSQTSANNTTAILNNVGTLSTNTGRAAAFAEDCANNTLNILDKVTTIASDTTQIRANTAAIEDIKDLMQYYFINTIVTEDSEGTIANFDTDLEDYLQALKVTIPADPTGYTGITLKKLGKNICPIFTGRTENGLTTTIDSNGVIHVSGTATGTGGFLTNTNTLGCIIPVNQPITVSISNTIPGRLREFYYGVGRSSTSDINEGQKSTTATRDFEILSINLYFWTTAGNTYDFSFKFQVEIGNNSTENEDYKEMTYPVSFGSTITDGAEADLLSGLVKVNTTPESFIQIQPIAVRTYKGVNNILSDVGSTALTYRETLKKYLEKHNQ